MNYNKLSKKELVTLLELREKPITCSNPQSVYDYLLPYSCEEQEHFIVILLDGANQIKFSKVITIGTINRTLVHPREIYSIALEHRAVSLIVAHNHPSGYLEPSADDLEVTYRLKKVGEIVGVPVVDHIVFGRTGFYSMSEHGELL